MAQVHGGILAARQLKRSGIDTLFGVVAGPMIELFSGGISEGLNVVGCRHEINGGFMASAWGWQKKLPGIFVAGSGPAVTNCVTPLYVATESAMPLIVFGGSAFSGTTGLGGFQELDQIGATRSVCKWTGRVDSTERIPEWIHLAVGKALEGRPGGVYLDFPGDLVGATVEEEDVSFRTATGITQPHPDPNAVQQIADMLSSAKRPLILVGKGAAWSDAGPAIQKLVDLGIPYVCAPMARGTLPDDHPNFANAARSQALSGADLVIMFGGRFNWIFGMGRRFAPDATVVQIDVEPEDLLKFGLIPEFVGRLPVIATLHDLDVDALVTILQEPKNAIAKQYHKLFELEDVELTFTDEALRAIAERAIKRKTGARGLRSIVEAILLDTMFDLPDMDGVTEIVIDKDVVEGKKEPIQVHGGKKAEDKEEAA